MRVGLGTDLHRLEAGRRLMLGGVQIPSEKGPVGHSDGDVVLHALTDALLGGACLGDIGELFPDTDPAYKDADSRLFVSEALRRVRECDCEPTNVDIVVQLERPKIAPVRARLQESVSEMLNLGPRRVSIKAKTNEGVGAIGRGEAIACQVVVLIAETAPRDHAAQGSDAGR